MKHFIITLLTLVSCSIIAGAQVPENADAVYTDVTHEYTLNVDGTITYNYEHHLKLLTHFAFDRAYGETFIVYDPRWQTLKITAASTTMSDGSVVESPGNAFNEVLPGFAAGAAPYIGLREMVVTHTGVEKGAVIHLAYSIITKPGMSPGLIGRIPFGDRSPIQNLTVRLNVPEGTRMACRIANTDAPAPDGSGTIRTAVGDILQSVQRNGGPLAAGTYQWTARNLPMYEVEPDQPSVLQTRPVLYFSSADKAAFLAHNAAGLGAAIPDDVKAFAAAAAPGSDTPESRAYKVKKAMDERIGVMGGDIALTGYRAMPPAETFRRASGSALDRAVLLAALCRAAGLDADAALGSAAPATSGSADAPAMLPTGTAYVVCRGAGDGGTDLVLDPIHSQTAPILSSQVAETIACLDRSVDAVGGAKRTANPAPHMPSIETRAKWNCALTLDADGRIGGTGGVMVSGAMNPVFEPNKLVSQYQQAFGRAIPGIRAEGTPDERGSARFVFTTIAPGATQDGLLRIAFPATPGGMTELGADAGILPRKTPYELHGAFAESCTLSIALPKGAEMVALPSPVTCTNEIGGVTVTARTEAGVVTIEKALHIDVASVPVGKYKEFQQLVQEWNAPDARTIIVKLP